jgi:hypothetical protein
MPARRPAVDHLDEVGPVGSDEDLGDVHIGRRDVQATIRPTAVQRGTAAQIDVFDQLVQANLHLVGIRQEIDRLAAQGRHVGLSWASIGWALGIGHSAAIKRFGGDDGESG